MISTAVVAMLCNVKVGERFLFKDVYYVCRSLAVVDFEKGLISMKADLPNSTMPSGFEAADVLESFEVDLGTVNEVPELTLTIVPSDLEVLAKHVLEYANSRQLRRGWGAISECYSLQEMIQALKLAGARTKSDALAWARSVVKITREVDRLGETA